MVRTPTKRTAPLPLDDARPSKRQATSSPEEGELDDSTPPVHLLPRKPPSPVKPSQNQTKVPLPFKTRARGEINGTIEPERVKAVVYERPEDVADRIREKEDNDRHNREGMAPEGVMTTLHDVQALEITGSHHSIVLRIEAQDGPQVAGNLILIMTVILPHGGTKTHHGGLIGSTKRP
jgi:hypothetical protein